MGQVNVWGPRCGGGGVREKKAVLETLAWMVSPPLRQVQVGGEAETDQPRVQKTLPGCL